MNNDSLRFPDAVVIPASDSSDSQAPDKNFRQRHAINDLPEIFGNPTPKPGEAPSRISTQLFSETALAAFDSFDRNKDGYLDDAELVVGLVSGKPLEKNAFSVMINSRDMLRDLSNDEWSYETNISKKDIRKFDEIQKDTTKLDAETREARALIMSRYPTNMRGDDYGDSSVTKAELEAVLNDPKEMTASQKLSMQALIDNFDHLADSRNIDKDKGLPINFLKDIAGTEYSRVAADLHVEDVKNAVVRMQTIKADGKALTARSMQSALDATNGSVESKALAGQFNTALLNDDMPAFNDAFLKAHKEPYFREALNVFNRALHMNGSNNTLSIKSDESLVLYRRSSFAPIPQHAGVVISTDGTASVKPVYSNENISVLGNSEILDKTPRSAFNEYSRGLEQSTVNRLQEQIRVAEIWLDTRAIAEHRRQLSTAYSSPFRSMLSVIK